MKTGSILRIVLGAAVTPVPVTFNFAGSVRALVIAALLVCSAIPARAELQLTRVFSNPNPPSGSEALSLPQFGFSVAWLGNRPLIGAPGLDRFLPNGTLFADAGAAYLFDADTASLLATFLPPISISDSFSTV
jgi:hypothetical protein